ncbi:MAG: ribosome silencing factor [Actinomycetaceae bacterium]|nr:ribosome silencing factor [Actinomycetaceae bacterium]
MSVSEDVLRSVHVAAKAAADKLADDIVAIDVTGRLPFADAFLIASADTDRQLRAIVSEIIDELAKVGVKSGTREGTEEARWVAFEAGGLFIHVFQAEDREFYGLERLWKDCPRIDISADIDVRAVGVGDLVSGDVAPSQV